MDLSNFTQYFYLIEPEVAVSLTLVAVVVLDLILNKNKKLLPVVSIIGLLVTLYFVIQQFDIASTGFANDNNKGLITVDSFAAFFKLLVVVTSLFVVLFSVASEEIRSSRERHGEYYALLFGMILGMFLMVSASDLILIYLAVELLSLSSYVLAGFIKNSLRNSEASLKYIIYGGVSSGVMLFGISILYGITGTTNLTEINEALKDPEVYRNIWNITFVLSGLMILTGIGFKISVAPFHFWTPDVYEGAPIPITAYLSVASKAAGFALLIRFLLVTFNQDVNIGGYYELIGFIDWQMILILLSILTMTLGNFAALWQDNIKRMLAYSSIAHAGYILLGVVVLSNQGLIAVLIYFAIYAFMNLGAFFIVLLIANKIGSENIDDYSGLGYSAPLLGVLLTIFLISLTGLPPTAGFIAKLYLFMALVDANMITVAIIALLNSVVSLYYYIRVLKHMYLIRKEDVPTIPVSFANKLILIALLLPILVFGVYFTPLVDLAKNSVRMLGF